MNQKSSGKGLASRWRMLCLALLLAACGGLLGKPSTGGESHFLRRCAASCGAGLDCISGLCTRGCLVGKTSCAELSANAVCTALSIEPGAIAVCDVSCSTGSDCDKLGSTYECDAGFCRGQALTNEPPSSPTAGNAGQGGGAGTATSGGSAGSDGAPIACTVWSNVRVAAENCAPDGVCVDDPTDACDPNVEPDCSGTCRSVVPTLQCAGLGQSAACPPGLTCLTVSLGPDAAGQCVGRGTVFNCDALGCTDGFVCVEGLNGPHCSPDAVNCRTPLTCDVVPDPQYRNDCPFGYTRSAPAGNGECEGPCVPVHTCGCTNNGECPENTACNYWTGHCAALPWKPPALCSLRLDPGTCEANARRFGMQDGKCIEWRYGGCDGNANNFWTLEECLSVCEGRPHHNPCPDGRVESSACLGCGPLDECTPHIDACSLPCNEDTDCEGFFSCSAAGFCAAMCI